MMTFKQRQEYYRKRDAMLKAQGKFQDEPPLFFTGARGCAFETQEATCRFEGFKYFE
jgi:hypothetical protein